MEGSIAPPAGAPQAQAPRLTLKGPRSWCLPLTVGIFVFAFVWVGRADPMPRPRDFDYLWRAGRAVWQGENPYTVVRQELPSPLSYPATAAVLMAPFGALPRHLAGAVFAGLSLGLLVWSVTGWRRWIILSAPAIQAILFGQWSPLLTAAIGLPWLGFVWAAKPNIGLALFGGWPLRVAVYGGLAVLLLSFLLLPRWPVDWLDAMRGAPQYRAPLLRPGGFLLLLAFLRWRRPEARMLGLLAVIPHTTGIYEQLPLLLIPQTERRFAVLMGLTYLAAILVYTQPTYSDAPTVETLVQQMLAVQWPYFLVLVYVPALWMVLTARTEVKP